MSDLVGNQIVGFPMHRLSFNIDVTQLFGREMPPVDAKKNGQFADHDLTAAREAKIQIMTAAKKGRGQPYFPCFPIILSSEKVCALV